MHSSPILNYKKIALRIAFTLFLTLGCLHVTLLSAQEPIVETHNTAVASTVPVEEKFDISTFILHHIADAHSFHIMGKGESSISIPLPVILWAANGPVFFMSSAFHHDDEGKYVVEKNGQRFINLHEKIYYASAVANEHGEFADINAKHQVSNAMPIDLSITKNVFTLIFSSIVLAILFIRVGNAYKKRRGKAPKGFQSLMEPIILFIRDEVAIPNLGSKYEKFLPYLLTIFFFIWFNNIFGLVPFFPGGANLTGNINLTFTLALFTFVITTVNGNKYYWGHIFTPNVPWWLYPLMIPVEIIGIFTKPIVLMIRLFANITAGHILVLALLCLIFIFKSFFIAPVSVIFVVFISMIEVLVGLIQAFIFTVLTALYIGMAVEEHGEH